MTARTFERQGDYDQALVHLSQAQQILAAIANPQPVEQAQVLNDLGWIKFRKGDLPEARQLLSQALDLAEQADAAEVVASIHNRLGGIAYNHGDWDLAVNHLRKSIVLREALGDLVGLATSFNNLGLLEIEMGKFESALENLTRSYEIKNRLGQTEGVAMALNNLGWLRIQRGELKQADETLKKALDLANQIGYSSLIREIIKNISEMHLAAGEWDEAARVLRGTTRELMGLGATDQLLDTYRLLAEAALGAGDVARAQSWERIAKDLINRLDDRASEISAVTRGEFMRFRGMLATKLGEWEQARTYLKESETIFSKLRSRLYQGRTTYQLGLLAEAQGDYLIAQQKLIQAAALFRNVGAVMEAERAEIACSQLSLAHASV
jgi:tetratricopeptide (TPR) repeat protein